MYAVIITWLIVIFGTINIFRIGFFMIGSDIYSVIEAKKRKKYNLRRKHYPSFSVIIPAHNEEGTIINCVKSVEASDYPKNKLEIIVVDDGSTDGTLKRLRDYKRLHSNSQIHIVTQANAGKANALNNAMANHATGKLIMCLDADSSIAPNAISEAAYYFNDKKVMAMAANVKIRPTRSILNFAQQYEYLIGYQLKKALTAYNIEYIIGGIGSVFRRSALERVGFYDTNTFTEDIDLTMKMLQNGGKNWKIIYGASVIAYTESVMDLKGLITQRYRWKFGRMQTFFKNKNLFFNSGKEHNRVLTWVYLPFVVYSDISFIFEPLMVSYLFYIIFRYADFITLLSSIIVVCGYIMINVLMESTIPWKRRIEMALLSPSMYALFYLLNIVEYIVVIKGLLNLFRVKKSLDAGVSTWQHVERPAIY
ncbi:MAG TPA: glycosyltransferase [Patescibacteria group bacterium]|jgi:cellulose synthase/poly-beta-1,6-N-acetylglucosamine synthase-like glycosyltransferase|nr:glycosyltransferase [Patescibacteria group bacterium]